MNTNNITGREKFKEMWLAEEKHSDNRLGRMMKELNLEIRGLAMFRNLDECVDFYVDQITIGKMVGFISKHRNVSVESNYDMWAAQETIGDKTAIIAESDSRYSVLWDVTEMVVKDLITDEKSKSAC